MEGRRVDVLTGQADPSETVAAIAFLASAEDSPVLGSASIVGGGCLAR